MSDDHLDTFIRESEERLLTLTNALLALEDDPTDGEAMDGIFRTAHTLKGNFGAMGFQEESRLAHALEDLLDEIRDGRVEATPDVVDHLFEGVDQLEAALDEIEETGDSSIDPDETIASTRDLVERAGQEEADAADEGSVETGTDDEVDTDAGEAVDLDSRVREAVGSMDDPAAIADVSGTVAYVEVAIGESDMPGIDAMLILERVTDALDVLHAVPALDAIQDGEFGESFELLVNDPPERVDAELAELSTVDDLLAADASDEVASALELVTASGESGEENGDAGSGVVDEEADTAASDGSEPDEEGSSVDEIKSVRVDVEQLDRVYGLVEQLVTSRIKLRQAIEAEDVERAEDNVDELDKITTNLQDTVMDMRLIPLRKVVTTFPRLVRDLARDQGKEIEFEMEGTDIELDRTILDEIADPLMHVLRNAVDHGIEQPEARAEQGKPREGTIQLRASRDRDHVTVTIADDGRGLDPDAIRERAIEMGVREPAELEEMPASEVYDLVFHPGFSTSEEVTDVSGRGVGMDVVRSTVSRLDGSVSMDSTPSEGTEISIRLPVSVAIVRVLFVHVGEREYGIPIKNVDEIARENGQVRTVNGDEVVSHDDELYPLVRLDDALEVDDVDAGDGGMLVRIREAERRVALRCDAVSRQEEVVIKPFEGELADVRGLSGTAVIGDGNVVPILDVGTL